METKSLAPTSAPGIRVPASELDASEIFVTSGAGQLGQMIVRLAVELDAIILSLRKLTLWRLGETRQLEKLHR